MKMFRKAKSKAEDTNTTEIVSKKEKTPMDKEKKKKIRRLCLRARTVRS